MLDKSLTLGGAFYMSKYSVELKLKIVNEYLEGKKSFKDLEKEYKIKDCMINRWFSRYMLHGVAGLMKNQNSSYSGEFKLSVLEYMHANHLSCNETAIHFNISDTKVAKWERIYYEEGIDALFKERRGRKSMSSKPRKKEINDKDKEDLIAEVQRLRAENAYLKKLRALVQERIQQEQKKK